MHSICKNEHDKNAVSTDFELAIEIPLLQDISATDE